MHLVKALRACSPSERALVLASFFLVTAFQSSYFIGIIGYATYALGAGPDLVSLLTLAYNAATFLGSIAAGILIDRRGPRQVLLASLAGGICLASFAWAVPLSPLMLMMSSCLFGLAWSVSSGTLSSFAPYLTQEGERLKQLNGLIDTATSVSVVVGPAIGGTISAASSTSGVFAFMAASLGAALTYAVACKELPGARQAGERDDGPLPKATLREFGEGLRVTLSSRDLRLILAMCFFGFFAFGAFDALESVYYRDVLRLDASWMGWLSMVAGVGCTLGSLALLRIPRRQVSLRLLATTLLVEGLGAMLYVGTRKPWCAVLGQLVLGVGNGLSVPVEHTLVQERCEIGQLGRVSSVIRMGIMSSGIVPLLLAPLLADRLGAQSVLFAASTTVAIVALAFLLRLRVRRAE